MDKKITRGQFIKLSAAALALLALPGRLLRNLSAEESGPNGRPLSGAKGDYDLVAVKGNDPAAITVKAVEKMGGMGRFVKKGGTVLIKPNIGWDRSPEQAGNTNPLVVAALVEMAYKAGAKRVNVFDITCNNPQRCYANSGIEKAAAAAGAKVYFPEDWDTVKARFSHKSLFEGWPVLKEAIECDTFINVPVLKHHSLARLTLSMKNLMGVCGGDRGVIHRDIGPKLVDLTRFINPDLTVIDAYRVLMRNGPTGGNLADVNKMDTVIVATDPVLADTYAARLVNVSPSEVPYLRSAVEMKYGSTDIDRANTAVLEA